MTTMKYHHTENAPEALGPYSQAVEIDGWLYTSAQSGLDPVTNELAEGGFEAQARQVLKNLQAVLATGGCSFQDVVRTTIYILDFANFPAVNSLYAEAMGDHRPARTTLQVSAIPKAGLVAMDMIARVPR
ncbi:MAG TPA: Rid family detoxifying hydrolase [Thermoanaerobaculia bacterium]|jgi:2-iminobutanoate/2-iminopropanoate deaminase|nr:Rid family detoxifying hydrolase [Thermoanaerobaculia bacterium]